MQLAEAGGGWYGGYGGEHDKGRGKAGGGGSGYTGGVSQFTHTNGVTYSPSMSNGANAGNGQAKITFVTF